MNTITFTQRVHPDETSATVCAMRLELSAYIKQYRFDHVMCTETVQPDGDAILIVI